MCTRRSLSKYAILATAAINILPVFYFLVDAVYWSHVENDTDYLPLAVILFVVNLAVAGQIGWALHEDRRSLYLVSFVISTVLFLVATYQLIFFFYYGHSGYEKIVEGFGETATVYLPFVLLLLNILLYAVQLVCFYLLGKDTQDNGFAFEKTSLV